jgi:hypothetical protein
VSISEQFRHNSFVALRGNTLARNLSQNVGYDFGTFDAAEFCIQALEFETECIVIDSQLLQHRRVQIVHGGQVLDNPVSELVGSSVNKAALDTRTCEPNGHGFIVVVPTVAAWPWPVPEKFLGMCNWGP